MVLQLVQRLNTMDKAADAGLTLASLRRRFIPYKRWFLTGIPPGIESNPADLQAFREHTHKDLRRSIYFLFVLLMFINVFYWFTDAWIFQRHPLAISVFAQWRSSVALTGVAILLAQWVPKLSAYTSGIVGGTLICLSSAHHMALLGGPGTPWFHFLYPFMLIVLIAWATPFMRIGVTCLMAAAILGGYFGLHPQYLADPLAFMALGYFAYIVVLCYLLGLYNDNNRLRLFMARLEVERARDILNARVMEQTIILAGLHARLDTLRDAERKTLAQELHDELGQLLTAQRMVLESTRQRYRSSGASIEPNLVTLESLLDRFSTHFRSQLNSLRPPVLEGGDIREALRALVERWRTQVGISCTLALPPEPPVMDAERAGVVYRFVQEALTNVARHAVAQQVEVSITEDHGRLRARVQDDGVGMELGHADPSHQAPAPVGPSRAGPSRAGPSRAGPSHLGLLGIRERVEAIGGTLEIHAAPGQGTTLEIHFPLTGPPPRPETHNVSPTA